MLLNELSAVISCTIILINIASVIHSRHVLHGFDPSCLRIFTATSTLKCLLGTQNCESTTRTALFDIFVLFLTLILFLKNRCEAHYFCFISISPKTFKWWLSILICASFAASKSDCFDEAQAVTVSPTSFICNRTSANLILSRWRLCVEMFGQAFLESVGSEPSSVLNELGRFDVKETKFRREMERLRNSTQRDLTLEVKFCLILFC